MTIRGLLKKDVWWALPFHQVLSTIGIIVLAAFGVFSIAPPAQAHRILTGSPYFPAQVALALLTGLILPHGIRHWAMHWVWILPFLIVCVSFALTPLPVAGRFEYYFGWGCRPELRCFNQLAVTLPFYTSAAYSLAAFSRSTVEKHNKKNKMAE